MSFRKYINGKEILLPNILDMAILSSRIYDDFNDMSVQKNIEALKVSQAFFKENKLEPLSRSWEITRGDVYENKEYGLKMGLYISHWHKCSVLAIRGTDNSPNNKEDVEFFIKAFSPIYNMCIKAFHIFSDSYDLKEYPLVACTGHSLGGIIAKTIAPVTELATYAFNSPGVILNMASNFKSIYDASQYNNSALEKIEKDMEKYNQEINDKINKQLQENNFNISPDELKYELLSSSELLTSKIKKMAIDLRQEIKTFVMNQDVIGNYKRNDDFGEHVFLQVQNEAKLSDKKAEEALSIHNANRFITQLVTANISAKYKEEFIKFDTSDPLLKYHSIKDNIIKSLLYQKNRAISQDNINPYKIYDLNENNNSHLEIGYSYR